MPHWNDLIEEGHPGGLCPLCDNAIESWSGATRIDAHGVSYLAHQICVDEEMDGGED